MEFFLLICGLLGLLYLYRRWYSSPSLNISVVNNYFECETAVKEIYSRCDGRYRAVGFDCEWVREGSHRHPVALLQLSTLDGYVALFRLSHMQHIHDSLKFLLSDISVFKVGVAPIDDAKYLRTDYGVVVRNTLDIRHIVKVCGFEPGGLAALASKHLGITLDKHWTVSASDWEASELTERQIKYAAYDAYVAVKIFIKLIPRLEKQFGYIVCDEWLDLPFTPIKNVNSSKIMCSKNKKNSASPRLKPLYQNGFMLAPDGELLCTCDTKKAQWYIDKGLADKVKDEPFTIQLKFEPAGRAVGEVGRYYQQEKENKCVVCGKSNSYIRKNVVPREYRKYFPDIMKDHSSHDVVLLCLPCHQRSNISDMRIRVQLATRCDAPCARSNTINKDKYIEDSDAKTLRSAARALLHDYKKHNLPVERRRELEKVIRRRFPDCEITEELLGDAMDVQVLYENESYESHGSRVVEHYIHKESGGLLKLEKVWREHFLRTMKPKYLPELWSVNHNEDRLMIRVQEGRIDPADIRTIGLKVDDSNL